jgi:hypothetical protein
MCTTFSQPSGSGRTLLLEEGAVHRASTAEKNSSEAQSSNELVTMEASIREAKNTFVREMSGAMGTVGVAHFECQSTATRIDW